MSRIIVIFVLSFSLAFAVLSVANAQNALVVTQQVVEGYVKGTWKSPPEGWQARIDQDETQRVCSASHNNPSKSDFETIQARELATIVYPADGKILGDWRAGEAVAQIGTGGQFSDAPSGPRGGNCYACHQMAPAELSYGTLGPSLVGYGKLHKFDPVDAKAAYAKIFNAQSVLPCSNMPRFGFHKFLSEQQMKDVTAYLFDPESPVNKP